MLAAQQAAIEQVRAGNHWDQPHLAAVETITVGLCDLGIIQGPPDEAIETEAYKPYCPHRTGHWLGLDVHDVGEYRVDGQWRVFEQGMVTTIEPGVYIDKDSASVPEPYRGIGIRIEDNVLVTTKGCEVITAEIPSIRAEVEAMVGAS